MQRETDLLDVADTIITLGKERGLGFLTAEDEQLDGRTFCVRGRRLLNFASCSYLGLETEPHLKEGAMDATRRHGTQFSSSRSFVSAPLYRELEGLLEQVFEVPPVLASSTTLAHLMALPVVLDDHDAVIVDHQVHHSVHLALQHARLQGAAVEPIRHGRHDQLERRIAELSRSHRRVWHALDGVFSMQGELAPVDAMVELLERYPKLHLYVDDAHGMSWCGTHGRGWVLSRTALLPRMIVATSLNKGFAAAGAALLVADPELRRRIATLGGPMLFCGPIQPPMLGAAVASARLHLSEELVRRQEALRDRVRLFNRLAVERELPLMAPTHEVPIRFVAIGPPKGALDLLERLQREGFFVNGAVPPAVPERRSGIRLMLNAHLEPADVEALVGALGRLVPEVLREQGYAMERVRKLFALGGNLWRGAASPSAGLTLQHERSVERLDREEWDRLLGDRGSFTWEGLRPLEAAFRDNAEPESNHDFHYFVVRDARRRPVLATFFTEALWKDDMLAAAEVSRRIEARRRTNPYFLTSWTLAMGSPATEGDHLFLDRSGPWKQALLHLLEAVGDLQGRGRATRLMLRDLPREAELDTFLAEQGLMRFPMLDSMVLDLSFRDDAEWLEGLSYKERWHQKRHVLPFDDTYETEVLSKGGHRPSPEELAHLHGLYRNVWRSNLAINTFELPSRILREALDHDGWELLLLRPRRPMPGLEAGGLPVAFALAYRGPSQYAFMLTGLDYRFVRSHGLYRQVLRQVVRRAKQLGVPRLLMGLGTAGEKRGFGARPVARYAYAADFDGYGAAMLVHWMGEAAAGTPMEPEEAA